MARLPATLIFFEGPSRLAASLADMAEILGERDAAVARELTKRHEEVRRGRLGELAAHYRDAGPPRGEVGRRRRAAGPGGGAPEADIDARLRELLAEHGLRDAVAQSRRGNGFSRRALYERALAMQKGAAG